MDHRPKHHTFSRVGHYWFAKKSRLTLRKWAKSANIWHRRMAIVSTHYFIRHDDFQDTLDIAEILLQDTEDLIHKAVGWMLCEVGKRDMVTKEQFLSAHYKNMPRTMLCPSTMLVQC